MGPFPVPVHALPFLSFTVLIWSMLLALFLSSFFKAQLKGYLLQPASLAPLRSAEPSTQLSCPAKGRGFRKPPRQNAGRIERARGAQVREGRS